MLDQRVEPVIARPASRRRRSVCACQERDDEALPFEPHPSLGARFLPDRDVLTAHTRERFAIPALPTLAQSHLGELRHEIEFRRPDIAERNRRTFETAVALLKVMRDQPLVRDVVLVNPPMLIARSEDV